MNDLEKIFSKYAERYSERLKDLPVFRQETAWVADVSILKELLLSLKKDEGFDYLVDVTSVDHGEGEFRFEMIYELCRLIDGARLRIKTKIGEKDEVSSAADIWRGANWMEREVYDMMGIRFSGHPDLRRILMWEGYPYHPLRKDFPLEGLPSEMPDEAFSQRAPMEGGPFVTQPSTDIAAQREPRSRKSEA